MSFKNGWSDLNEASDRSEAVVIVATADTRGILASEFRCSSTSDEERSKLMKMHSPMASN